MYRLYRALKDLFDRSAEYSAISITHSYLDGLALFTQSLLVSYTDIILAL